MSFMAGFGEAFSRGFEGQTDRIAQKKRDDAAREDDLFKMKFQVALARKDKYDSDKKEDAKAARRARDLAQMKGLDAKAVPTITEWIRNGSSEEEIDKALSTGKFDFTNVKPIATPPEAEIDTQTEEAFGVPLPSSEAAPESKPTGRERPAWLKTLFGNGTGPGSVEAPQAPTADARVADVMGVPQEELYQTYQPDVADNGAVFTPGEQPLFDPETVNLEELQIRQAQIADQMKQPGADVANLQKQLHQIDVGIQGATKAREQEAQFKAAEQGIKYGLRGDEVKIMGPDGMVKDVIRVKPDPANPGGYINAESGEPLDPSLEVREYTGPEKENQLKIQQAMSKPVAEYEAMARGLTDFSGTIAAADKIIQQDPEVLTGAASIYRYADEQVRKWGTILDDAKKAIAGGAKEDDPEIQQALKRAEGIVSRWDGTPMADTAQRKLLLDALQLVGGYQLGAIYGQTGKSIAEGERKAFMEAAMSGRGIEGFRANYANIIKNAKSSVDNALDSLKRDPQITGFIRDEGYNPIAPESLMSWDDATVDNPDVEFIKDNIKMIDQDEGNASIITGPKLGEEPEPNRPILNETQMGKLKARLQTLQTDDPEGVAQYLQAIANRYGQAVADALK